MRKLDKSELKRVYGGNHGHGDKSGGLETLVSSDISDTNPTNGS